jgi:hypothetical protein
MVSSIFMAMLGLAHLGVTDSYISSVKLSNSDLSFRPNYVCGMYEPIKPNLHVRSSLREILGIRLPGNSRKHGLRSKSDVTATGSISLVARDELLITKPRTSHCWYGLYFDIEAKECAVEIKAIRSGTSR